ncbi:hypothetical protein [Bordetella trematum]|uniref:hypothetical protein n=1 Tax=Bordetella trematum TaxID=123899 RepID=UPI0015C57F0F|nr:hypothetical protein [Bordetella trematum]
MIKYPRLRVFLGFSLCPLLAGPLISGWLVIFAAQSQSANEAIHIVLAGSLSGGLVAALNAIFFYGIPAILLAFIYILVKLTIGWIAFIVVASLGALSALIWNTFVFPGLKGWASASLGGDILLDGFVRAA